MLRTRPTQKACASSTTSFRTSRRWCSVLSPCTSRSSPSNCLADTIEYPEFDIHPQQRKERFLWHNVAFSEGVLFYLLAAQTGFLKLGLTRKFKDWQNCLQYRPTAPLLPEPEKHQGHGRFHASAIGIHQPSGVRHDIRCSLQAEIECSRVLEHQHLITKQL